MAEEVVRVEDSLERGQTEEYQRERYAEGKSMKTKSRKERILERGN